MLAINVYVGNYACAPARVFTPQHLIQERRPHNYSTSILISALPGRTITTHQYLYQRCQAANYDTSTFIPALPGRKQGDVTPHHD